ncbi:MAG TPA: alpha/beta hydrolase [Beijerinckiaceae bacterium]|jgi:lysophospholipase|nr:alpha/beta hydrolase [Beijerinckiaceae bacterium]
MDLIITPENPAPPQGVVAMVRAADGMELRVARWHPANEPVGTVVVCSGRAQFVEQYFETIRDLLTRDLVVVVFDWRGQGLSGRELGNPLKGHIDDFSLYERDLETLVDQTLEPFCPRPWFALGHSMGAAVLLAQARSGRSPFERLVLTAPLIDIYGLKYRQGLRLAVEALDILGLGGAFVPTRRHANIYSKPFHGNPLTSDPQRFAVSGAVIAAAPQIAVGAPTIGWTNAAFRRIAAFADPEYPRRTLTPILVVAAGDDRIADLTATERFATRLKAGHLVVIPHARHEILAERDVFRSQFWSAFDAFVPGTHEADATPAIAHRADGAARRRFWSRGG